MLARKTLLILISRSLSSILLFIGLIAITRNLGPEVLGAVTYSIALVSIFNILADLGFNSAHQKRISEGRDINDCFTTYMLLKAVLILSMVSTIMVSIWFSENVTSLSIFEDRVGTILYFILYYVLIDIGLMAVTTYNGLVKTAISEMIMFSEPLIRFPLVIFVSLNKMGANELALAYVAGAVVFCLVGVLLLVKSDIKITKPTLVREYVCFAVPIALFSVINIIYLNVDKIIIGIFWDSDAVGYFSGANNIMMMFLIIGTATSIILFPSISKMSSEGDYSSIHNIMRAAEKYVTLLAIPPLLVIFLFPAQTSIVILGSDFISSQGPMRFLAIAMFFNIISLLYTAQLNAMNKPRVVVRIMGFSLFISMISMILLVPDSFLGIKMAGLSGTGAALANLVFMVSVAWASKYMCNKTMKKHDVKILVYMIAGALTLLLLFLISFVLQLSPLLSLVTYGTLSLILFPLIMMVFQELNIQDLRFLLMIVDPRAMKDYINDEIRPR